MKPIHAKAKRHTTILRPFAGNRSDVIFSVETKDGGAVSGKIEERRKKLMGYKSEIHDLKPENKFRISAISQGYRLSVIPAQDVIVHFQTKHFQLATVLKYAGIFFGGLFALGLVMQLLGVESPPPQ